MQVQFPGTSKPDPCAWSHDGNQAAERRFSYDDWFLQEVDMGLGTADKGEFVEHDDIRRMIEVRYPA
jgi:predicted transcriptional regulator